MAGDSVLDASLTLVVTRGILVVCLDFDDVSDTIHFFFSVVCLLIELRFLGVVMQAGTLWRMLACRWFLMLDYFAAKQVH